MQIRSLQSGVTLLELMVGLAVVVIIGTLAAPSFRVFLLNTQITSATNEFITALAFARSEAVKRSAIIRIDASGGDWDNGWEIVNDADNVPIRTFEAPANTVDITAVDALNNPLTTLRYDGRGLLLGLAGGAVTTVCHSGQTGRQITLSATGRPQLNRQFNCP